MSQNKGQGAGYARGLVGKAVARVSATATAPAAAPARLPVLPWGPEAWPADVRRNVKVWPPVFREREYVARINTPLTRPLRIALVSNKDGVGKSTTARILQAVFASARDDGCVILDANPGARGVDLGRRATAAGAAAAEVLGGHPAVITPAPGEDDLGALIDLLGRSHRIVICDVGRGIDAAGTRQILDNCDQIIVVATPAVDGLYAASSCLTDLRDAGYADLADGAVCAITRIRPMPFSDLLNIDRHFSRRCRAVQRIQWDSRATAGAADLDELRPTTRTAFYELAAAVTAGVRTNHPSTTKPREDQEEN